jgi:hypothetical protein
LGRADLGLPNGACGFDIDNNAVIRVDQVGAFGAATPVTPKLLSLFLHCRPQGASKL